MSLTMKDIRNAVEQAYSRSSISTTFGTINSSGYAASGILYGITIQNVVFSTPCGNVVILESDTPRHTLATAFKWSETQNG